MQYHDLEKELEETKRKLKDYSTHLEQRNSELAVLRMQNREQSSNTEKVRL